jgi:hypothetical protein
MKLCDDSFDSGGARDFKDIIEFASMHTFHSDKLYELPLSKQILKGKW